MTRRADSNRSTIRSARNCYPCLRNELLPVCPEWTSASIVAGAGFEPATSAYPRALSSAFSIRYRASSAISRTEAPDGSRSPRQARGVDLARLHGRAAGRGVRAEDRGARLLRTLAPRGAWPGSRRRRGLPRAPDLPARLRDRHREHLRARSHDG